MTGFVHPCTCGYLHKTCRKKMGSVNMVARVGEGQKAPFTAEEVRGTDVKEAFLFRRVTAGRLPCTTYTHIWAALDSIDYYRDCEVWGGGGEGSGGSGRGELEVTMIKIDCIHA